MQPFADDEIVLALPSKGSLHEGTMAFLKGCGMSMSWGSERHYTGRLSFPAGVRTLFVRAEEVPLRLAEGAAHIGITGEDLFLEKSGHYQGLVTVRNQLGYGRARLVFAVPEEWVDVDSMASLVRLLARFRERHRRAMRIATKFPHLTRQFLQSEFGTTDYIIVQSLGATEGAPASGVADIIVDLASTGSTLRENRLKEIDGGTILVSESSLIATTARGVWNERRLAVLRSVLEVVEATLRAGGTRLISAQVPDSAAARQALESDPDLSIIQLMPTRDRLAVELLVPRKSVLEAIGLLRGLGASPITTSEPKGVYLAECELYDRFRGMLDS